MADKSTSMKVPEFLREPIVAAQARLAEIEGEAQRVLKDLMQRGKESRKDFADLVQRFSVPELKMDELKERVTKLREQGMERAQELKGRAESFRADAVDRLLELQAKAVEFLGVATREQVALLSKEMERLSKRLDRADKGRKARKAAKRPAAEV